MLSGERRGTAEGRRGSGWRSVVMGGRGRGIAARGREASGGAEGRRGVEPEGEGSLTAWGNKLQRGGWCVCGRCVGAG